MSGDGNLGETCPLTKVHDADNGSMGHVPISLNNDMAVRCCGKCVAEHAVKTVHSNRLAVDEKRSISKDADIRLGERVGTILRRNARQVDIDR